MRGEYKIDIVVKSPVDGLWEVHVEGILMERAGSLDDAEHIASTYDSFPHDILKDMNEHLEQAAKVAKSLRRERFVDDRDFQLARHYEYMANVANAALRVSLLTRNVK